MRVSSIVLSLSVVALLTACSEGSPIRRSIVIPTGYSHHHRYDHSYNEDFTNQDKTVAVEQSVAPEQMTAIATDDPQQQMTVAPHAAAPSTLLNETYFRHGSASLDASDKQAIRAVANEVKSTDTDVMVVGHASSRVNGNLGAARKGEVNHAISNKRAIAVTRELTKNGVNPSKITSVAKGDDEPNAHPGDKTQEAADRRVEIFADDQQPVASFAPAVSAPAEAPVFAPVAEPVVESSEVIIFNDEALAPPAPAVFKPVVIEGTGPASDNMPLVIAPPYMNQ